MNRQQYFDREAQRHFGNEPSQAEIEQQYLDTGITIGDINAESVPACNCEAARGAYGHWLSCEKCR